MAGLTPGPPGAIHVTATNIANFGGARPVIDPDDAVTLLIESDGKAQAEARSGEQLDSQRG